ncbi:MAG: Outer rane lipoprotein carrier protein LolA [Blastocatellia bacterium]|nr:Outer rane lipoprotein carrier protein LolA [Blastocatellia bacterium]
MKKIFSISLVIGLILTAFSIQSGSIARAQGPGFVSSLYSRMEKNQKSLKSLRANISMLKYNAQLRDEDKYQGVVLYIPGAAGSSSAFVRLEWTQPQHEILAVANGNYSLYRPRLKQVLEGRTGAIKSSKDSDVLALMNMSATQLRTRFGELQDMRDETLWGNVHTTHFRAFPKMAASYKYIEVWVDDAGMPVQTKMVEKNDDSTTVRLTNVEKNQPIPLDQFKLKLDSDVKRLKG